MENPEKSQNKGGDEHGRRLRRCHFWRCLFWRRRFFRCDFYRYGEFCFYAVGGFRGDFRGSICFGCYQAGFIDGYYLRLVCFPCYGFVCCVFRQDFCTELYGLTCFCQMQGVPFNACDSQALRFNDCLFHCDLNSSFYA